MNIQQLRYVVAIANSGTFREAAEKMYVSQPSLSISVRDLEKELGFKIFRRTSSGTFLTRRGMEFYEKAQELVKGFDIFQNQYANPEHGGFSGFTNGSFHSRERRVPLLFRELCRYQR